MARCAVPVAERSVRRRNHSQVIILPRLKATAARSSSVVARLNPPCPILKITGLITIYARRRLGRMKPTVVGAGCHWANAGLWIETNANRKFDQLSQQVTRRKRTQTSIIFKSLKMNVILFNKRRLVTVMVVASSLRFDSPPLFPAPDRTLHLKADVNN